MKRSDLIYEAYLLFITLLMAIQWITDSEEGIFFILLWSVMLGLLQLGHSIIMAISYKENKRLKESLILFWAFAPLSVFPFTAMFCAIPMACYFWWSTWRYWQQGQKQQLTG